MTVSDKYKFIFFHLRKTGGTSVAVSIGENGSDPFKDRHLTPSQAQNRIPGKFKSYYKFSIIRNPFDRLVSCFAYDKQVTTEFIAGGKHHGMNFNDYLQYRLIEQGGWWRTAQADYLAPNGEMIIDFLCRFERLQEDFNKVCERVGMNKRILPFRRQTKHEKYWKYYNDVSRELIEEFYSRDLEEYGYKF